MANPSKVAVTDRAFVISLTQVQIAALVGQGIPTRFVDPGLDTYGSPTAGRALCRLVQGDVVTDAATITTLLGVTLGTADYPQQFYPNLADAH